MGLILILQALVFWASDAIPLLPVSGLFKGRTVKLPSD